MKSTPGVARGCGFRTEGAVYLETGISVFGTVPIWAFLPDPPIPLKASHTLGVDLVEKNGVWHIINHVGSKFYPFASDFIEEGLRWGFSTKIPRTLDLSVLTRQSRLIHVHSKGALLNVNRMQRKAPFTGIDSHGHRCRCAHFRKGSLADNRQLHLNKPFDLWDTGAAQPPAGENKSAGCNFFHWAFATPTLCDVLDDKGKVVERFHREEIQRIWDADPGTNPSVFRNLAPTHRLLFSRQGNEHGTNLYTVYPLFPYYPSHPKPVWESAVIASLPITNISVIKASGDSHGATLARKRAECKAIPVTEAEA